MLQGPQVWGSWRAFAPPRPPSCTVWCKTPPMLVLSQSQARIKEQALGYHHDEPDSEGALPWSQSQVLSGAQGCFPFGACNWSMDTKAVLRRVQPSEQTGDWRGLDTVPSPTSDADGHFWRQWQTTGRYTGRKLCMHRCHIHHRNVLHT